MTSDSATPVRLAVLNDHELVVRGVAAMLAPFSDRVEVVEVDAGLSVRASVDIALYDTFTRTLPDLGQVLALVADPTIGQVALYTWSITKQVESFTRIHQIATIPKSLTATELVTALEQIHRGQPESMPLSEGVTTSRCWPGAAEGLTAREAEIVALITAGLSNEEIAARTCLSINSVKSYIRTAYRTMEVSSRSQAVLWGIDHGMRPRPLRVSNPTARD